MAITSTAVQPRFQSLFGTNVLGVVDDAEVYSIESRDPQFSKIVVKMGFNPLAPEGSVILSKDVNGQTNETTLVCGVYADEIRHGQGAVPDLTEHQRVLRETGLFADAAHLSRIRDDIATNPQGVLGDIGIKTVKLEVPKSPLDNDRAIGAQVAQIVTENANLAGTRTFNALPPPAVIEGGGSIPEDWMTWLIILVVIAVVVTGASIALKKGYFTDALRHLGLVT